MTTCTNCQNFINLDPDSKRAHVWYNHICKANPLPTAVDPYDGIRKPVAVNDMGQKYFGGNEYDYCRNCNDGNCSKFKPLN